MTGEADTLILRSLRDIRLELPGVRAPRNTRAAESAALERRMVGVHGPAARALASAVATDAHHETNAARIDCPTGTVTGREARVEALESRT